MVFPTEDSIRWALNSAAPPIPRPVLPLAQPAPGTVGVSQGITSMWKTIGTLTLACAIFISLLVTLSIVGLKA